MITDSFDDASPAIIGPAIKKDRPAAAPKIHSTTSSTFFFLGFGSDSLSRMR